MLPKIGGNVEATLQVLSIETDAIGEPVKTWADAVSLWGYLDLQSGSKTNQLSTFLQDSTHVFVCDFVDLSAYHIDPIKPEGVRLICDGKTYGIVNIDNPMELDYQLEISLNFVGWQDG